MVGVPSRFKDAINFVLEHRNVAPAPLVGLVEKILNPPEQLLAENPGPIVEDAVRRLAHNVRQRLRDEPRNAIQWVELARLYTTLGAIDRAVRSMMVATELGPDSRFVVRSAARLFLHARDPGRALKIIRNASGAKTDPWLLAAEIAVASASRSPSLLAKAGRRRNEDSALSSFQKTELSSALATLELESGKNRQARQLFRQSLTAPNENSVAQVEWANRTIGGLDIGVSLAQVPRSYEANAQVALSQGEWQLAIANGLEWLRDQSFSKRPAMFTSYVTSLVEDYDQSIGILRASLKVNPNDPILLNNLAFALASANKLDDASGVLSGTDYNAASGVAAITLAATHGLLLFRKGLPDAGRSLYRLAMGRAGAMAVPKYRILADLYLAREEILARTSAARVTAEEALAAASKSKEADVTAVAAQIKRLFEKMQAADAGLGVATFKS